MGPVYNQLVDYLIAREGSELPPISAPLEYVLGSSGLFVRGERGGLEVMLQIALAEIRGLSEVQPYIRWGYPLVPRDIVEGLLEESQASARDGYEILFHLLWEGGTEGEWLCEIPEQTQTVESCKPLDSGADSSYQKALIELHSHHELPAFFSPVDDEEEKGFRIYSVIGTVLSDPKICVRVGFRGYWWRIPASSVFELPEALTDTLAAPVHRAAPETTDRAEALEQLLAEGSRPEGLRELLASWDVPILGRDNG